MKQNKEPLVHLVKRDNIEPWKPWVIRAASIIGGCYKFEPEKNVVPCLYATPQSIMEEKIKEAQEVMEREEREKQQEQEQKQQGQPKTETKK